MKKFALLALAVILTGMVIVVAQAGGEPPAVGSAAPEFKLQDQDGNWHSLSDYQGKWLALYFYPKDDTPGCTKEACNFRDSKYAYQKLGAEVVGVSVDDVESHKEFASKYDLPFTLLSDPKGDTCEKYGVLRDYKLTRIADRQSFIIDPDGKIAKHYEDVDPETHSAEVLADLEAMMKRM
ncbi:MAG: peroxiredoxin [Xanthomonadales bacterium]|nr:peroxiredoxin [Xanthomonadales bacterium]